MAANEEVVAELISKLVADVSNYTKGMKQSIEEAKKTSNAVEQNSKKIEGITKKLSTYAQGVTSVFASIGAVQFLKESLKQFTDAESNLRRLTVALEANGVSVDATLADYQAFAKQMSDITTLSGDETLALFRLEEVYGLTGEASKRAVKNAIALSSVTGLSAEQAAKFTAALEKGDTEMLARYIPALRGIKDDSERAAKAQEVLAKWFDQARAETKTTAGQMKQLQNVTNDLKQEVGGVVAEALRPMVDILKGAVKWFAELDPNIKRFIIITIAATVAAIAFWAAMNAGAALFDVLTGGVLIIIGAIIAAAALVAVWASQFEDLGQAVQVAQRYIQKLIDNWEFFMPVIFLTIKAFELLGPILAELWNEFSKEAVAAWEEVEKGIQEFMREIVPVVRELKALADDVWPRLKQIGGDTIRAHIAAIKQLWQWVKTARDTISSLFNQVLGQTGISFDDLRNKIVLAIRTARVFIQNWEDGALLIYIALKLAFTRFIFDARHTFTVVIPAFVKYLGEQIQNVFTQVFKYIKAGFEALINALAESILLLPDLLAGKPEARLKFFAMWRDVIPKELPKIQIGGFEPPPPRAAYQLEQNLQNQLDELRRRFMLRLLALDIQPAPEVEHFWDRLLDGMKKDALAVGDNLNNGIKDANSELSKFDTALLRSAERVTRIQEYNERIQGSSRIPTPMILHQNQVMFQNRLEPVPVQVLAANDENGKEQVNILRDIRDDARNRDRKPVIQVEVADLGG